MFEAGGERCIRQGPEPEGDVHTDPLAFCCLGQVLPMLRKLLDDVYEAQPADPIRDLAEVRDVPLQKSQTSTETSANSPLG